MVVEYQYSPWNREKVRNYKSDKVYSIYTCALIWVYEYIIMLKKQYHAEYLNPHTLVGHSVPSSNNWTYEYLTREVSAI